MQSGHHPCAIAAVAVGILMELGFTNQLTALHAPAVLQQLQLCLWSGAHSIEKQLLRLQPFAVSGAGSGHRHDQAGATPALANVLSCLLCPQRPSDYAAMADPLIRCHKSDRALCLELAGNLTMQRLLVGSSLLFEQASPTRSGRVVILPAPLSLAESLTNGLFTGCNEELSPRG